jgi:hypothetical protein
VHGLLLVPDLFVNTEQRFASTQQQVELGQTLGEIERVVAGSTAGLEVERTYRAHRLGRSMGSGFCRRGVPDGRLAARPERHARDVIEL